MALTLHLGVLAAMPAVGACAGGKRWGHGRVCEVAGHTGAGTASACGEGVGSVSGADEVHVGATGSGAAGGKQIVAI